MTLQPAAHFRKTGPLARCLVLNLCVPVLVVVFAFFPGCASMEKDPMANKGRAGDGSCCEYTAHEGVAEVVCVVQTPRSLSQSGIIGGPGYSGYEVQFRFTAATPSPDAAIKRITAREHALTLRNTWYVGPKFLKKYKIASGRKFPCTLKVLVTGTCSPFVFEFGTLDLADYFEARS